MFTKQQVKRLLASSTLVAGVSFGASAALAQEPVSAGCTQDCGYFGIGVDKISASGEWDLGYPTPERPDLESTEASLSLIDGPGLGASGVGYGLNFTFSAGVADSTNDAGRFADGSTVIARYTYEETARMNLTGAFYYSFAQRWHPYFEAGFYYALGSEATMRGTFTGCGSRVATLDDDEVGATFGFMYGTGMLVNVTDKVALLASYRIQDNVDFDFIFSCDRSALGGGTTDYSLASFDSKLSSYGLSLVYQY